MGIVTVTGEHDLLWGAQDGRPRRRLRQGPFLLPLPPTRSPLRPGTPQKVMLTLGAHVSVPPSQWRAGRCSGFGSSASLAGDYAGLGPAPRGRPVGYRRDDGSSGRSATSRSSLERSRLHSVVRPTETPSVSVAVRAGGGVLKPSFLCARVSISSPGTPDHLCAALDVGHVFSQGCCSTPGPHGLSMA
jgi:hypothetical protein